MHWENDAANVCLVTLGSIVDKHRWDQALKRLWVTTTVQEVLLLL
jgi:hypothetical protein